MRDAGFCQASSDVLAELAANTNREWFQGNKSSYKTSLWHPFAALLEGLTIRLAHAPVPLIGNARIMFRLNRDIRFSNNIPPYKTEVSGPLSPSKTKTQETGVLSLAIGADGGIMAAGWHKLKAGVLAPFCEAIVADPDGFSEVLTRLQAGGLALDDTNALARMPRGFEHAADHPNAEAIRLKSFVVSTLTRDDWTAGSIFDAAEGFARAALPLLKWGHEPLGR